MTERSKAWVCGPSPAESVGSNPTGGMDVCLLWVLCVVVRGHSVGLITSPEESYRMWCVVVCDLETSWMRRPWPTGGCRAKNKETNCTFKFENQLIELNWFCDVLLTVHLSIFNSVINQLDAQNFCFTISLFRASTFFRAHVLIIRRSTASGVTTPIGVMIPEAV